MAATMLNRPLLIILSLLALCALVLPARAQTPPTATPTPLPLLPFVPQDNTSVTSSNNHSDGETSSSALPPAEPGNAGNAGLEDKPVALTFPLRPGSVEGNINDRFPSVRYSYNAIAGESVRVRVEPTSGDLDPVLTLISPDGVIIARNDDEATGSRSSALAITLPAAGVYTIEASRYLPESRSAARSSGTFRLTLDVAGATTTTSGDPLAAAPPFAVPYTLLPLQTVSQGAITADAPFAYYAVAGEAGDLLRVIMTATSGDLAPAVRMLDDRAEPVSGDPQARSGEAIAFAPLTRTGWVLIEASAASGSGTFDLFASRLAAAPLRVGELVSGSLSETAPSAIYLLNGRLGEEISVAAFASEAEGGLQPRLTLLDVGQRPIATASGARFATLRAELPRSGPYLLQVSSASLADQGGYSLRLSSRPPDVDALTITPIAYNSDAVSALPPGDPFALYRFSGKAGDLVTLALQSPDGAFNPSLILMDADLNELASNDDSGASRDSRIAQFRLPKDGEFLIAAARSSSGYGTAEAAYRLSLTAGAVSLEPGAVTATLRWNGPTDLSLYVRGPDGHILSPNLPDSPDGGTLQIDSNAGCNTPSAEPVEHIFWAADAPPAGDYTVWAWNQAGCGVEAAVPFTLEFAVEGEPILSASDAVTPGQRFEATVRVAPDGSAGIMEPGQITVPLAQQQASESGDLPLRAGEPVTGTISNDRYALFFRFSGNAGDVVTLRAERVTGDLDPLLVLRDGSDHTLPGGVNDDASPSTRDAALTYTLPASGDYIISVTRYGVRDGTTTGDFRLTLSRAAGG